MFPRPQPAPNPQPRPQPRPKPRSPPQTATPHAQVPRLVAPDEAADALGVKAHTLTLQQQWAWPTTGAAGLWDRVLAETSAALAPDGRWDRPAPELARCRSLTLTLTVAAGTMPAFATLAWAHEVCRTAHPLPPGLPHSPKAAYVGRGAACGCGS